MNAVFALLLATAVAGPLTVEVSPHTVYVESREHAQSLQFDLIVRNGTNETLDLDAIEVSVFDRAGKLVLRRFIDGNGTRPSIRTADVQEIPAGATSLVFNPFHEFEPGIDLRTLRYEVRVSSKNGERRYAATAEVTPVKYEQRTRFVLPVASRMIVYDGHDFYAHHRRWDYTLPGLQQLGFHTNFMRYSYDFVPVNAEGQMVGGDAGRNENWFGFGQPVLAVAGGRVVAVRDDQPDDRRFDPSTIATDGPMKIWGNYIVIDHGHGAYSIYGHIRNASSRVKAGQIVKRGEPIAAIGASGSSLFPHLHYELQNGPDTNAEGLPSVFDDFDRIRGSQRVRVRSGFVTTGEIIESRSSSRSTSPR